jgi:hypothetical protein
VVLSIAAEFGGWSNASWYHGIIFEQVPQI